MLSVNGRGGRNGRGRRDGSMPGDPMGHTQSTGDRRTAPGAAALIRSARFGMTGGGKWPIRRRSANAGTTAEDVSILWPHLGQEDHGPDQLPLAGLPSVRGAAVAAWPGPPMSVPDAAPAVPPPDAAPTTAPVMPPPMAPAPATGPWPAGQWHQSTPQRAQMRAAIGDNLRIPTLLCEFGGCAARYTHRDAPGERDLRNRALAAGWQYDLIGRLACPACVRHAPTFWAG